MYKLQKKINGDDQIVSLSDSSESLKAWNTSTYCAQSRKGPKFDYRQGESVPTQHRDKFG